MKKLLTNLLLTLTSSASVLAGCLIDGGRSGFSGSFGSDNGGGRPGNGNGGNPTIPPIVTEPGPDPLPAVPISRIDLYSQSPYSQGMSLSLGVAAWFDGTQMFMGTMSRTFSQPAYITFHNLTTGETETALIPTGSDTFMVTINNPVGAWTVRIETADRSYRADGSFNVQSDLFWLGGFIIN